MGFARPPTFGAIALLVLSAVVGAKVLAQMEVSASQHAVASPDESEASQATGVEAGDSPGTPTSARRLARWGYAFGWGLVITLAGIFGAIAIVVFSRRFRSHILRGPRQTTQYTDAWRMYRLPPDSSVNDGANDCDPETKPPAD